MLEIRSSVLLGDLLACNEFDVTNQLGKVTVPTLIICGAGDKLMPLKFSELLQTGITNSQLHVLDKTGHMVMLEQPDAVADLLKQFIDNIPLKVPQTVQPDDLDLFGKPSPATRLWVGRQGGCWGARQVVDRARFIP